MLLLFQNSEFNNVLEKLDFSLEANIELPEIIFLNNYPKNLHPKHHLYLEFAKSLEVDAVYFKYYDDSRFCLPQVYFLDNSNSERTKEEIASIHRNIYSSNQVALLVVIDNISITLFDTKKPVKSKGEKISNDDCRVLKPYNIIKDLNLLKSFFNAKSLNTSLFWESDEASNHFRKENSAYEKLIDILGQIRTSFVKDFAEENLKKDFAEDLLFKCILIKYLEENSPDSAKKFYQRNNLGYQSLNEIISNKKILDLFNALENHFNGKVFELAPRDKNGNIDFLEKEKQEKYLKVKDLSPLATHLEGFLGNGNQVSLWQEYSFKHMPIELISNFYEQFIPKDVEENKGTVYTPSFLVNFLVDECLPISENEEDLNTNVKLADVSCGSGIFITTAFKRLVQRLRVKKWIAKGKPNSLPKPSLKEVKKILTECIFGVDIHPTSVKLSKFSLQLAICQLVPTEELWNWNNEKIFADLEDKNIFQKDFFDFLVNENYDNFHNSFDLIIGNPPFLPLGEKKYNDYVNKLNKIHFSFSVKIPDYQLALMFLEASSLLLKEKGKLCFIQKSTALLYNKGVKEYRDALFNNFHVEQIIDFTLLKNELYKSKSKTILDDFGKPVLDKEGKIKKSKSTSVESCAVFYTKNKVENYSTLHVVSRLLKSTKEGLSFEFDFYDFFEHSKDQILEDDTIWRCNLLGGNRINYLVKRLDEKNNNQTNLEDYLLNILKIDKNSYSEGFMKGTPKGKKLGKNKPCNYITNKKILLVKNFDSNFLVKLPNTFEFYYSPNEKAFLNPLITIRENLFDGKFSVSYHLKDVAYDSQIVGISFSDKTENDLQSFLKKIKINEKINATKTLSTCSKFFLGRSSVITKNEIDNWIIPLKSDKIELSFDDEIIVNDVLDYIYPSWYEGSKAIINRNIASYDELEEFSNVFNKSFNEIYAKENKKQRLNTIIEGNDFYALEFSFGKENNDFKIVNDENELEKIIQNHVSKNAIINRVIKIYGKNSITLIKPKTLRYWLKSIALRDADDVFDDIIKNGLK
ncbi:Eco57I restriction-modification methylase domain-containing protein [Flavobacterium sp.]|uniref:Eco57I restriction-modification methylase domain-containing protein n=1 Tax=Flavobacterium sp. TaxID=239 RepID=UPI0026153B9C|nr:Eco57I restriction-modification methylase domain-containing protein [Flavobacterium sp.]